MTREEAIERIKSRYDYWALDDKDLEAIQCVLPEFAESEDERIRRAILIMMKVPRREIFEQQGITKEQALDWLEKQKEQKPAEWSEEDDKIRRNLMSLLVNLRGYRITEETYQKYYPWLKSLRPQTHWKPSEEQMEALDNARFCKSYDRSELDSLYEQLKKLM